jgi:hypothetical protein
MTDEQPKMTMLENSPTKTDQSKRKGASEMCKAANMILDRDCLQIAEALSKSGIGGHLQSIKFLYELAKVAKEPDDGGGDSEFRRQALEWAAEPEWQDEDQEEDEGSLAASGEPES